MMVHRRMLFGLAASALLWTSGCGSAVHRGERHLDAGRYDRAAELAAQALVDAPSARAHALAGEAARRTDDLDTAWAARADARSLDPGDPTTLALGARLAVMTNDERLLAEVWVDAWRTAQPQAVLEQLDDGGLPVAAASLSTLWRETPDAADALLDALVRRTTTPSNRAAVTAALSDAADLQLYRLVADRDLDEAEALLAALEPLIGESFVLRKHRTLVAAERSLHPARGPLLELVDGDPDALSALAFELRARGVHRTAALAWRIVAERTRGESSVDAWRQAAESEYRLGFEARAREAHEAAFAATTRPAATAHGLYRTATSRGDALALDTFADRLATIACEDTDEDTFAEAFDTLVEGWIIEMREPDALVERLLARDAELGCPGHRLIVGTAIRMAEADYEPVVASGLLHRAVAARPISAVARAHIALAERRSDPLAAAETLNIHVDRLTIDGWPSGDAGRALIDVITTGRSDAVRITRIEILGRWHAAAPGDRDVARTLADELLADGTPLLTVWEAHASAVDEPWHARLYAAAWMTARDADPDTRIDLLERITAEASTRRMPLDTPTNDADTVYEQAALLLVDAYLQVGRDRDVVDTLEGWIASRGPANPATWTHIWSRRALIGSLGADERARLARRAVDAGYATSDIWHELAVAESGAGRDAAARAAIDGALAAAPERTGELVDRLVDTGRVALALYTLDAYTDLRGDDVFVLRRTLELHVDELLRARGTNQVTQLRDHRNGVARVVTRVLTRGQDLHMIDLERLRLAGLDELAWRVGARRVHDPAADRFAALEVARDALSAGLPVPQIEPWLAPWQATLDEDDAIELAALALAAGHADLALELRLGVFYDQRQAASRVAMLAPTMYAASISLPLDGFRALVEELVEAPARSIVDPSLPPIPPYEAWADDEARAAELFATAAALYEMRGLDADVVRTAQRALELGLDVAAPTLESAVTSLTRTTARSDLRETVSALVGATSLGAEGWSRVAHVLIVDERWDDAAWALNRAADLVAVDEPSLLSWSGVVAAHRGDDDGVRRSIEGLNRWGRDRDPALAAGLLRTHVVPALVETARHDLIDRAIEAAAALQPGDDDLQVDLARRLLQRGESDGARRRASDVAARTRSTRDQIRVWLRAGFPLEAARLFEQSDDREPRMLLPTDVSEADELPGVVARLYGAPRWYAALDRSAAADIDAAFTRLAYSVDGLCLATASQCGPSATPIIDAAVDERLLRGDVIDLATLAAVRGDLRAFDRAWRRAAGEAFAFATFDPEVPPAVVLANHAEADALDSLPQTLDQWMAQGVEGADEARRWLALLEDDALGALDSAGIDAATLERAVAAGWTFEVAEIARDIAASDPADPRILPGIVAAGRRGDEMLALDLAAGWMAATGNLSHPRADVAEALIAGEQFDDGIAHLFALLDAAPDTVAERAAVAGLGAAHLTGDLQLAEVVVERWLGRAESSRSHQQRVASTLMDRGFPALASARYARLVADVPNEVTTWEAWIVSLAAADNDAEATLAFERMRDAGLVTSWTIRRLERRTDPSYAPRLAAALHRAITESNDVSLPVVVDQIVAGRLEAASWIDTANAHPAAMAALIEALALEDSTAAAALARDALAEPVRSHAVCDAALRALVTTSGSAMIESEAPLLDHTEACRALAPDPNGWQTAMATAMAEAGAWSLADRLTTQVLLEEPDNGIARAVRAAARAHMGRVDDAVTDIERSQGVDAAWRDTLVFAGRAFVSAGAHDAAMRVADRLAARVVFRGMALPGTPRTNRDGLFDAFDALAPSPDLTLQWLETRFSTLRAHPELTAATTAITNALVDAGHVDEALAAWRRARLSRPDSALALNNHAWTIADQGDSLDEAEILARRAVALEREPNANTLDTLAWVLHLQGRHDNARAVLVRALAALYLTPPAARREARAVLVEHLGAIDAAIAAADAAHSTITREQDRRRRRR